MKMGLMFSMIGINVCLRVNRAISHANYKRC